MMIVAAILQNLVANVLGFQVTVFVYPIQC